MLVYKATHKGQVCRGVKLVPGMNVEPEANCVKNGWHAAEDPLDCLRYYPDEKNSEFWVCNAEGDIDEDGTDSKISCTHLTLIKQLSLEEFVMHAIAYMLKYPGRRSMNEPFDHGSIYIVAKQGMMLEAIIMTLQGVLRADWLDDMQRLVADLRQPFEREEKR